MNIHNVPKSRHGWRDVLVRGILEAQTRWWFHVILTSDQWLFLVPVKGGLGSIWGHPEGKEYKWYISSIYCQLGDYMLPTTLLGCPAGT